jgi:hypothetical protein
MSARYDVALSSPRRSHGDPQTDAPHYAAMSSLQWPHLLVEFRQEASKTRTRSWVWDGLLERDVSSPFCTAGTYFYGVHGD